MHTTSAGAVTCLSGQELCNTETASGAAAALRSSSPSSSGRDEIRALVTHIDTVRKQGSFVSAPCVELYERALNSLHITAADFNGNNKSESIMPSSEDVIFVAVCLLGLLVLGVLMSTWSKLRTCADLCDV